MDAPGLEVAHVTQPYLDIQLLIFLGRFREKAGRRQPVRPNSSSTAPYLLDVTWAPEVDRPEELEL